MLNALARLARLHQELLAGRPSRLAVIAAEDDIEATHRFATQELNGFTVVGLPSYPLTKSSTFRIQLVVEFAHQMERRLTGEHHRRINSRQFRFAQKGASNLI